MNQDLVIAPIDVFPPDVRARLERLVNPDGRSTIEHWFRLLPQHPRNRMIVSVLFEEREPIAWAVAFHHHETPRESAYNLGVFVLPAERRKGYGRQVLETLVARLDACHPEGVMFAFRTVTPEAMALYAPILDRATLSRGSR